MALLPHARFSNLYGPTETNVCTWYDVPPLPPLLPVLTLRGSPPRLDLAPARLFVRGRGSPKELPGAACAAAPAPPLLNPPRPHQTHRLHVEQLPAAAARSGRADPDRPAD